MSTQVITSKNSLQERSTSYKRDQYSLWQIIAIWAGAALPMGLSYWVIVPLLLSRGNTNPFTFLFLINAGLVWQGVLAYILLRREVKPFTWQGVKDRLWLHTPSNPKTGVPLKWLYLWTLPLIAFNMAGFFEPLNELWVKTLPFLEVRPYAVIQNVAGPAEGQWWLLGMLAVQIAFNYVLGEELIFRGILLPKMNGVFGKWDWLANNVLFSMYHLHFIFRWPSFLIKDWVMPWATKRFNSYWMSVIIHGAEAVILLIQFPMAIMGLIG